MEIVLIAGLWLDSTVWRGVVDELQQLGHRAVSVPLPGQGDERTSATLADQLTAVLDAVDATAGKVFVVGHSAAASLAWLAVDARPARVGKVAFVGGFPVPDGQLYADFFPVVDGAMPFPGWDAFQGPDSADLDEKTKAQLAATMIPVPEGVSRGLVFLTDERRYEVPVVLVCPEFDPAQAREWIRNGDAPELAKARHLSLVDINSGHWPMVTAPVELARVLAEAATA